MGGREGLREGGQRWKLKRSFCRSAGLHGFLQCGVSFTLRSCPTFDSTQSIPSPRFPLPLRAECDHLLENISERFDSERVRREWDQFQTNIAKSLRLRAEDAPSHFALDFSLFLSAFLHRFLPCSLARSLFLGEIYRDFARLAGGSCYRVIVPGTPCICTFHRPPLFISSTLTSSL